LLKLQKFAKKSIGLHSGPQEEFSKMLCRCCTLKRAPKRAVRLSVRLSELVSVQSL